MLSVAKRGLAFADWKVGAPLRGRIPGGHNRQALRTKLKARGITENREQVPKVPGHLFKPKRRAVRDFTITPAGAQAQQSGKKLPLAFEYQHLSQLARPEGKNRKEHHLCNDPFQGFPPTGQEERSSQILR